MKKFNYLALASIAALAMGSCSNESDLEQGVNDGSIRVSASINQVKTRATDSDWAAGDKIGVTDDKGNNNVAYVASSSNGGFTAVGDGITIKGNDTYTFKAYYPYTEEDGEIEFNVVDENYNIADQTKVDFLYASGAQATRNNPNVNFAFSHKMAKLALTFTNNDESLESDATISYTISNVATEGTFDTATGVVTAGEAESYIKATPELGEASTAIVPSFATANTEALSIVVVVENGGETVNYSGTITPELLAGNQYSYTLDIAYGKGLTITGGTINGWQQNTGDGTLAEGGETPELPHTTVVGDYLLKDGSILDYNKTEEVEAKKDDIVGVVYFVGNPQPSTLYPSVVTADKDILKTEASDATHGLAIAVKNANNGNPDRLSTTKFNFNDWFTANESTLALFKATGFNASNFPTQIAGYNNTKMIQEASESLGSYTPANNDPEDVGFANLNSLLETANQTNVAGASNWYLPSFQEFYIIAESYETIQASIVKAGGTLEKFDGSAKPASEYFYWTSDYRNASNAWISVLDNTISNTNAIQGKNSSSTKGYFRFAIAF